jgi:hypothetical protein
LISHFSSAVKRKKKGKEKGGIEGGNLGDYGQGKGPKMIPFFLDKHKRNG